MKITLFFCAGNFAESLKVRNISQMRGVGRKMPWTMAAFTAGAFGMMGVPPLAGFVSKWYLGLGGLAAGQGWVVVVLVTSGILNAMYFLPMVYLGWFKPPHESWRERLAEDKLEARATLLGPTLVTAGLSLLAGLVAASMVSPLALAKMIADRLYSGG
jgi:multicomponent Na+:H+ antiporter subunit D